MSTAPTPGDPANYRALCKECHQVYDEQIGAHHANAKLSTLQAEAIRDRYASGGVSQTALADEYGVNQTTISSVVRGRRYKPA